MREFDICVIGSGAGGAPIAYTAALAGHSVVVIEKGPWYTEKDFFKDEIGECRRNMFTPKLSLEPQVVESEVEEKWVSERTSNDGYDFWNGCMVGGSSNLMSGFFQRLKPDDFKLKSVFGQIDGANIEDWPITYDELEPYYDKVEKVIGVSGRVVKHPFLEPRSSSDFPLPPLFEHPIAKLIDQAGQRMGLHPLPLARAVLSQPHNGRNMCSYSNYCGGYACATGAKGNARAALINSAVSSGRCEIRAECMARRLVSDSRGKAIALEYYDKFGELQKVSAKIFVVACQAIESARLLLKSTGTYHINGLGNRFNQVGKNLLFSAGATVDCALPYNKFPSTIAKDLKSQLPFINRSFQDWYFYHDQKNNRRIKGGTLEVIFEHPNAIALGRYFAFSQGSKFVWGDRLKRDIREYITSARHLVCETFCDWLPVDNCNVTLDSEVKDKWGMPVSKVRIDSHPHNEKVGNFLGRKAEGIFKELGGTDIYIHESGGVSTNLQAGGCRFGSDPKISVLDKDCRVHDAENVFVSDGSFMPTGGSVPYTWTIYANSFRVADKIISQL